MTTSKHDKQLEFLVSIQVPTTYTEKDFPKVVGQINRAIQRLHLRVNQKTGLTKTVELDGKKLTFEHGQLKQIEEV